MIKIKRGVVVGAVAALSLLSAAEPALAADFTPEGQQHWLSVAQALTAAASGTTDQMGAACTGVTIMGGGAEIRQESSQVPKWAVNAHFQTCIGFSSVSSRDHGKGFMSSTNPCANLKAASDELAKAKQGIDPDDVVAAAGKLRSALISMAADYKEVKACKFATAKMF
jgi:hypothetical protein